MSCRYPNSNNLEEFWNLLFQGEDGSSNPPPFRWLQEQSLPHSPECRKTNAGFLKEPVDGFDAKFFGISPKETISMDPQHRLLHEVVWESLENAAIDPHSLRGSLGSVFLGSWLNDYKDIMVHAGHSEFYRGYMGNSPGAMASRISFLLGMTGPSIATESGCSSAMVALHLACKSLRNGETNMALSGGVNLLLRPFDRDVMPFVVSPDGHCKTFDENADGFARAEGCGVLVLKRLSDAVKNGDRIWAVIRGTGISQEGVSKSMGTPTVHCESQAMEEALQDGYVRPEEVSYVEAHGTGTVVGDPMEVAAIAKAYHSKEREEPLIIGSVKTNIGHTEACSGITGIMKVVLSMTNEVIPAHRNFTKLNPAIDLNAVPARIPLEPVEWKKSPGKPRIAGVSSFGITGTDAHAIVEEAPTTYLPRSCLLISDPEQRPSCHILKISAKTEEALDILVERHQQNLDTSSSHIADICYTANVGRANFSHRVAVVGRTKEEMVKSIQQRKFVAGEASAEEELGKICFLFTGQGSQYPGMAREMYKTSPIFQMHFDQCAGILQEMFHIDIKDVMWQNSDEISRTIFSQTSIFCVEYALLKLWESWGVRPSFALGHSLGEFAAAVCAGILSVRDALTLVAERSGLIDNLPRGKMLVIKASKSMVDSAMKRFAGADKNKILDYAAVNSPDQTVVAGDSEIVMEFSRHCSDVAKLKCVVLEATHAFHSKHMDPMLAAYRRVARSIEGPQKGNGNCQYISGMKGALVEPENVDAEYWVQHTREKVSFLDASRKAVELGCDIFIEIGPHPVLSALVMMNNENKPLTCVPSIRRGEDEWPTILTTLGKLYCKGVTIDWSGLDSFFERKKVDLPLYPFIGKKFWPDLNAMMGLAIHPLIGSIIPNATSTKLFQSGLNLRSHEYIKDHAIGHHVVFPGAGYLEMCLAAGLALLEGCVNSLGKPSRPMKIENLMIESPLELIESKTRQVQTVVETNTSSSGDWDDASIKIFEKVDTDLSYSWRSHAKATFSPFPSEEDKDTHVEDFSTTFRTILESESEDDQNISQVYDKLASIGLKFGPVFRSIEKIWRPAEDSETSVTRLLAKVKVPEVTNEGHQDGQYIIHPAVLDAMLQAIMMLKLTSHLKKRLYVPIKIGKFVWISSPSEPGDTFIYAWETSPNSDILSTSSSSAILVDSTGQVLGIMSSVEFIDTTARAIEAILEQQTNTLPDTWEEVWKSKLGTCQHRADLAKVNAGKLLEPEEIARLHSTYNKLDCPAYQIFCQTEQLCYLNMVRALYECGWEPLTTPVFAEKDLFEQLKIHERHRLLFHHYLNVLEMEGVLESMDENKSTWRVVRMPPSMEQVNAELTSPEITDSLASSFKASLLLSEVGRHLSDILLDKESALSILFPEGSDKKYPSAGDFYDDYGITFKMQLACVEVMNQYAITGKARNPERFILRILEVGAGTGTLTRQMLPIMEREGVEYEYTFTDISAAFFSAAEKRFADYVKHMRFKKLNLDEDPISQGFCPEYYDIVVASDVIHVTKDLRRTFKNIWSLMKPNGRFDMIEQTCVNRVITFLFGLLDGFWQFQDFDLRKDHCILSSEKWTQAMESCGFDVSHYNVLNKFHGHFCVKKIAQSDQPLSICATPSPTKIWLLFHHPNSEISEYLMKKIGSIEHRKVILVTAEDDESVTLPQSNSHFVVRRDTEEDFKKVLTHVTSITDMQLEGILYCWPLDKSPGSLSRTLQPYFYMLKALAQLTINCSPKVVAVVEGVASPLPDCVIPNIFQSTMIGLTKSFVNERSEIQCRVIDMPVHPEPWCEEELLKVFYEVWSCEKGSMVALHQDARCTPVFSFHKPTTTPLKLASETDRFQLVLPESKAIADLQFGVLDVFDLGDEEVEIRIKASALNFKDVFSVMKPIEEFKDSNAVGFDYAGVVKRIGSKVTKWQVGDFVFGVNVNGGGLPSHAKVGQNELVRIPENMTFCEAATLPAVVSTAYYCLVDVAKLNRNDTVLLHTASGGVGLAAIQLCRHIGANIICTAGSKRKRNYLRSLGIQHVFHSRNTEYGDKILEVTQGRGVTVVLNSITSEGFKEATLKACAKGARFVEMSKLNIWQPEEVTKLRPDVSYTIVDLSIMDLSEWRRLIFSMEKYLSDEVIHPIPYVRFDALQIREALQYLQKAKHVGKVVCVMPEVKQNSSGQVEVHTPMFNSRSTYLITGGLGGIGFTICQWMVTKHDARHVILAGRNPPNASMEKAISKLNADYGANVIAVQLDVGDRKQCEDLLHRKIKALKLPRLRGIMHAAGTLQDGLVQNQTWTEFSSTFPAKVEGSYNLHELTKASRLEHFVLFSSMASLFGPPGQGNHSAGNMFEDTLAHYRHSIGLPATTVNWGQWGEVGVATEVEFPGINPFSNNQAIAGLEYALKSHRTQLAFVNVESFVVLRKLFPNVSAYLDEQVWKSRGGASGVLNLKSDEFWRQYDSFSPDDRDQKLAHVQEYLKLLLRHTLKLDDGDEIQEDGNFQDLGVDSLMFVELKNAIQTLLSDRVTVNATALRDCNTLRLLSNRIVDLIDGNELDDFGKPPSAEEVAELIREDSILPEHIRASEGQREAKSVGDLRVVLLTGCTGTLGQYMLRELTSGRHAAHLTQVVCLMRPHKTLSGLDRLEKLLQERELKVDMRKVRIVYGNVAEEHLGMEDPVWEELSNGIDAVFHCAASVHHMEHYRKRNSDTDMRKVNIQGTKNVLEFCCAGSQLKVLFNTSSLLAASKVAEDGGWCETWPEIEDFDGVTTFAYPITKFVGDMLLKEAVLNRNIPAKVFRLPLIFGDSKTGRFLLDQNHVMYRYLFILKTGVMSSNPIPMALLPVDICASVSVQLFFDERCSMDLYNVCHHIPVVDQEFVEVAARLGYKIELVEFSEFAEKVRESTTEDSPFAIFKEMYRDDQDMLAHYTSVPALRQWVADAGQNFFISKKVAKIIPEFYESLEPTKEYIYRDLKFAKDVGWFTKFQL